VGPCVTKRARIGNDAKADAALSIHADGGPATGQGFAILEPVADGINDRIIQPSEVLGTDLREAFAAVTGEIPSTYDGVDGIKYRTTSPGSISRPSRSLHRMRQYAQHGGRGEGRKAIVAGPGSEGIAAGITDFLVGGSAR